IVVDGKVAATDEKLAALKTESAAMRDDITAVRKNLAETNADITDIRDNLRQLRGQVEVLRKDLAALSTRANRKDEEYKELRENISSALNNAVFKINFIENFLGIGKKEDPTKGTEKGDKLKELSKGKPSSDKELAYASAYDLFKDGKFDKAREAFQNFLKQYSNTEYSDNAQFWIAECFYFEKKYENAILEYEKVAKNYPEGDKVPYALLKQGIAFLNLGDKTSAKLILQRVIKDYPNTNQARTAKAQLLIIK
ncbi:MAG: tol-pal system protein YbgF, partial [Syntrophobacteraceae bacterium CG23_combo_of_CG06-09_8_20_14_all_50_8]